MHVENGAKIAICHRGRFVRSVATTALMLFILTCLSSCTSARPIVIPIAEYISSRLPSDAVSEHHSTLTPIGLRLNGQKRLFLDLLLVGEHPDLFEHAKVVSLFLDHTTDRAISIQMIEDTGVYRDVPLRPSREAPSLRRSGHSTYEPAPSVTRALATSFNSIQAILIPVEIVPLAPYDRAAAQFSAAIRRGFRAPADSDIVVDYTSHVFAPERLDIVR